MAEQFSEIITGEKAVIDTLRRLIDSRIVLKMEIPRAKQSWITLLLEIRPIGNDYLVLIDRVAGFEAALSKSPDRKVSLEFMEKGGGPSRFTTRVIASHSQEILSELPKAIYRTQRRQYFRIEALLGAEITFLAESSTEQKNAKVKNYSAGGVAFFIESGLNFSVGDSLTDIHLIIPEGERVIRFHIPKAAIRRIEPESGYGGKALCVIEFIEMQTQTRNDMISHIFRQQRVVIQRIRS
jgi:c-di-GMP-binding flagellar brake protein YcgR